jgi:thiosulfate/3-mercaptopyruvate sulfurtransferase
MDDLVSTEWLAAHLRDPDLRILDGSWHMPQARRDPRAEFAAAHLPGAAFFDIDGIADHATSLPHMLPTAEAFAEAVGALGVGADDRVVVYDTRGVVSAARVWWTFRAFGHEAVAVLDGGLPKWKAENRPLEAGEAKPARRAFRAVAQPMRVRDLAAMRDNLATRREQVLDAQPAASPPPSPSRGPACAAVTSPAA